MSRIPIVRGQLFEASDMGQNELLTWNQMNAKFISDSCLQKAKIHYISFFICFPLATISHMHYYPDNESRFSLVSKWKVKPVYMLHIITFLLCMFGKAWYLTWSSNVEFVLSLLFISTYIVGKQFFKTFNLSFLSPSLTLSRKILL